ncbi:hypothetical protein N7456_009064 [Penicillium angulare]|uniref:Xylanolytic transcriptional activator regulatory domain-containing protein n=1 Tax=Penicillium angulare TaxID=116970 RepID=A0A9W9F3X6_9EURO|nr:hypothetical protein N7456_009064 [Penicillium angulare]
MSELTPKLATRGPPEELSVIASPPVSLPDSRHASLVPTAFTPTTMETMDSCFPAEPLEHQSPNHNRSYDAAHGQFASRVAATIEERADFISPNMPSLIPLVDAPLFGNLVLPTGCSTFPIPTEMPARADADQLVDLYWRYVDPAEPILDRHQFSEYYASSYSTSGVSHIQLSIIHSVLALAMQRREFITLDERDTAANTYFRRAWSLFPTESVLWEPGSLEQVQCLMLMNRYLHCTNNQLKTWMTAGLAMRIAQNMCCHYPETSSADGSKNNSHLKRKVWASCVFLDRCVSWSLGKTSAIYLIPSLKSFQLQEMRDVEIFQWGLELHEIGNQIQLAQVETGSTLAARSVARTLGQQEEYHTAAVHLDSCLNKWEMGLPSDFQLQNIKYLENRTRRMERYLLHIRLLHSRIYLYRPILARFYLMKNDRQSNSINAPSLSERLLKEGARMCVEAAQAVASLIVETLDPNQTIGILPWWTRIYCLHIAGVIFLAAMVRSDLFTDSVSQSWQVVLAALRAHVHLSTYVQQCIWTFEALSARILQTGRVELQSEGEQLIDGADYCFDNIFEDIQFDFGEFLFRTEDVVNLDGLG